MSEQNTARYLKYAVGEIILVVIGILIALQINNWNETRKNKADIERILIEVQQDLLNDIQEFGLYDEWSSRIDTLTTRILEQQIDTNTTDNKELMELYSLGRRDYPLKLSDASYRLLVNQKDKIPNEYREMLINLNSIYEEDNFFLSDMQNAISNFTHNYDQKIHDDFDWVLKTGNGKIDKDATRYVLSSESQKQLHRFRDLLRVKQRYAFRIRDKAVFSYLVIRYLLSQKEGLPNVILDYGVPEQPAQAKYDRIFEYVNSNNEANYHRISEEYGQIVWQQLDEKSSFYNKNWLLKELQKDSLQVVADPDFTIKFFRNSDNKITHAQSYKDGKPDLMYKAVEND